MNSDRVMDLDDVDDAATSSADSRDSRDSSAAPDSTAVTEKRGEKPPEGQPQPGGGGAIHAVLWWIVQLVLASVQGLVVLEWFLGKVLDTLVWAVELSMLLVQPPSR